MTTTINTYTRHTFSAAWGDISETDWQQLLESVAEIGFIDPTIWLHDEAVLDGWNRVQVAIQLEKSDELEFKLYTGADPGGFVIARNGARRNLTDEQRAQAIVKIRPGATIHVIDGKPFVSGYTTKQMADEVNVTEKQIQRAEQVHFAGLGDAVENGDLSARQALNRTKPKQAPAGEELLPRANGQLLVTVSVDEAMHNRLHDAISRHGCPMSEFGRNAFDMLLQRSEEGNLTLPERTASVRGPAWKGRTKLIQFPAELVNYGRAEAAAGRHGVNLPQLVERVFTEWLNQDEIAAAGLQWSEAV